MIQNETYGYCDKSTGTYRSDRPIIRISSFASKLTVILSKQRPRQLLIKGDNGQDYQYMLKGWRMGTQ